MKQIEKTTPLHKAASEGKAKRVKELIEEGEIDLNGQDKKGNTALKLASQSNGLWGDENDDQKPKIIKMLLEAGADPNIADEDEDTPLMISSSWSDNKTFEEITFLLLDAGADIHKVNNKNQNALHLSSCRNEKVSLEFIHLGIDVELIDIHGYTPFVYAFFNERKSALVRALLEKMKDTSSIEALICEKEGELEIPIENEIAWYSYQAKQQRLKSDKLLENIKNKATDKKNWTKICGLFDYCIENKDLNKALEFDQKLTQTEVQIGYEHKYYSLYKTILYWQSQNEKKLHEVLRQTIIYGFSYRFNEAWRPSWKLTDEAFESLAQKVEEMEEEVFSNPIFKATDYPIEMRPFIWLEKTILKRVKQKCALTDNKLTKGQEVYKFRNLTKGGKFSHDFFYADVSSFEANPQAMENKRKFEQNSYKMTDFAFYVFHESFPLVRNFWYHIESFNLEQILRFLSEPFFTPSSFKHRYGDFIKGQAQVRRKHEYLYHTQNLAQGKGASYLNIWHALIKCGYIDQIIEQLPNLPSYIPYLLLCFDIQEVRKKTEVYLNIEGIAAIFELAFKSYSHKNEKDLQKLIQFGLKHPEILKDIAKLLDTYELHLYNVYIPTIDWYCKAFDHFSKAKGAGLLDLLIPNPHLLKPLSLLLEHGGELTEKSYSDTEIFFIRTVILYTTLFNGKDMQRLWKSLSNNDDGNVYFEGIAEKVYNKTYDINQKLVKLNLE